MSQLKVFITDFIQPPGEIEHNVFGNSVRLTFLDEEDDRQFSEDMMEEADALMVWHASISELTLRKLRKCKIIMRYGVGFENINLQVAGEVGIPVCNNPDYGTHEVADTTWAMMLALVRRIQTYQDFTRSGNDIWSTKIVSPIMRLSGKVLGIIGMGRIGTAVAMRAKAFGLSVVFYDPYKPDGYDKSISVERIERLEDLLNTADIISVNCLLNEETRGMIDENFLCKAKRGAILINTARGAILKSLTVLENALQSGQISAAGLDVLPEEPPDERHPLICAFRKNEPWIQGRLLLTPHSAFYSEEAFTEMRQKAALNVQRALHELTPKNIVNGAYLLKPIGAMA